MDRPTPDAWQQNALARVWSSPRSHVIGIDEVGYGACAGPLVVAGVLADRRWDHELARDSKKLTPNKRRRGYDAFVGRSPKDTAIVAVFIAAYDAHVVDCMGLYTALHDLTRLVAVTLYGVMPAAVVLDGDQSPHLAGVPVEDTYNIVAADALVPAVSAASVVAKVHRDHEMDLYDEVFPGYGWKSNKGYLTEQHETALLRRGACVIHRLSYKKVGHCVVDSTLWQYRRQQRETPAWTSFLLR